MAINLKNLLQNIKDIYMSDSNLETLLDYERVLDEMDLYSFKNWKKGELVAGPIYEKYFVTCKWKYNYRDMPDPDGGARLLNYGCEVVYELDTFEYPIDVKSPDDFKPGTKVPRLVSKPIWVISITIPKKLMSEIEKGSIELENEILDKEEIETAAEEGEDNDVYQKQQGQQQNVQQPAPIQ
jgi:hypothetical protein